MDPLSQNVYRGIGKYLKGLVSQCIEAPSLQHLPPEQKNQFADEVEDYLSQRALEIMVDKMTEEQFAQIEHLEPGSPEMVQKVEQLAAQVPGLAQALEEKFQQDVEYIKQNGQIPPLPEQHHN